VQLAFRIMGLAGRLLFALGIVCLLLGGWLAWQSLKLGEDAIETTGRVVSYHEIKDGDSMRYRPRVRFKTPNGNIVTIEGQLTGTSKRFEIGAEVPVIYPRMEPTKARLNTYVDNWLGATIAAIVGLVSFVAGLFIRRAAARDMARTGA
jgi:Protein of unknown function (DUF3592)